MLYLHGHGCLKKDLVIQFSLEGSNLCEVLKKSKMLILLGVSAAVIVTIVAIIRSKKPLALILEEAKYEILYNIEGANGLWQDIIMKRKNKLELPLKSGKVAVITGGTRGIGLEVIKLLLKCDITVILGCRNTERGETLLHNFRENGIASGQLDVYNLDVSIMESVKKFAADIKAKYPKIHFLINNAGIMFGPYIETKEGFENQFATNYLGHFLLIHLLLPALNAGGEEKSMSRIINVSSCAHKVLRDFKVENIVERKRYIEGEAYAQSKLAQILLTKYLNDYLKNEKMNVEIFAVHPGIVNTDLFNDTRLKNLAPWVLPLFFKSAEEGAIPIIYTCLSNELEGEGGSYIVNCQISSTSKVAESFDLQKNMFEFSNDLLKIENFGGTNAN